MTAEASHSAYLEAVRADLQVAARRQVQNRGRRRAWLRVAAVSLAALIVLAGTAVAGQSILGRHASGLAQSTIDSLWKGGERTGLAPLPGNARAVAHVGGTVLYRSPSADPGSVCLNILSTELVLSADERHQDCIHPESRTWPTGVVARDLGGHLAFFGQVHPPPGGGLVLDRADGDRVPVPLGLDGWFLGLLPLPPSALGTSAPLAGTLRILAGDGRVVSSIAIRGMLG